MFAPVKDSPSGQVGHGSVTTGGCGGLGVPGGGGSCGAATDRTAESWSFVSTRSFDDVVDAGGVRQRVASGAASTVAVTRISVVAPAARSSSVQVTVRPETEQSPCVGLRRARRPAGRPGAGR